jgi:hypothetical protein
MEVTRIKIDSNQWISFEEEVDAIDKNDENYFENKRPLKF